MRALLSFAFTAAAAAAAPAVPTVPLGNSRGTAQPGLTMPAIGLGTGAYSDNAAVGYGGYPECWSTSAGCGGFTRRAVASWLSLGGRRIDAANSYQNDADVGAAIAASAVPRSEIFLLSKVGPSFPLGFNETLAQFEGIKARMGVDYLDTLLIHWPWPSASKGNVTHNATQSSDPLCNTTATATYDEKGCRLSTWAAMLQIYASGGARSIGVSNYNVSHMQEIADAGLPLPALTQSPFHLYLSGAQMDIASFCWRNGIVFLGYSPLGVPDYKRYAPPLPAASQLEDPVVASIAAAHPGATPAQVLLAWQWALGVPTNPRTMSPAHMAENLAAYALTLNQTEVHLLSTRPQDLCQTDPVRYAGARFCAWRAGRAAFLRRRGAARLRAPAPLPLFFYAPLFFFPPADVVRVRGLERPQVAGRGELYRLQ